MGPGSKTALLLTAVPAASFITSFGVALLVTKASGSVDKTPAAIALGLGAALAVTAFLTYQVVKA